MERRFLPQASAEVRVSGEDGAKKITGYASVFYDGTPATEYVLWDDKFGRAVERIMPGTFDGALKRADDVRGLKNHEPSLILGRTKAKTLRLAVDDRGLSYEIDPPETTAGRDTVAELTRGDLDGSSFAFKVANGGQKWTLTTDKDGRDNDIREITDVEPLYDVGPVTYPAYDGTTAGYRDGGDAAEARASRDAWRESEAGRFVSTPRADAGRLEISKKELDMQAAGLL